MGMLHFDIEKHLQAPQEDGVYDLNFLVRSGFKTYTIVVADSRRIEVSTMDIKDVDGNLYLGPEDVDLLGQAAKKFTAPTTTPLKQVQDKGAQLSIEYTNEMSNDSSSLEMDLPNPDAESIKMYQQGEHAGAYFSDTIVYV